MMFAWRLEAVPEARGHRGMRLERGLAPFLGDPKTERWSDDKEPSQPEDICFTVSEFF
jgi:hypothetical protein